MRKELSTERRFANNPIREVFGLSHRLNRIFDDWMGLTPFQGGNLPACDLEETDSHYLVCLDVPGMSKDDINVEISGNQLRISGERKSESGGKRKGYFERSYGSFERSLTLPSDVSGDNIEANYRSGVLELAIPKKEAAKSKKIAVGEGKSGFFSKFQKKGEEPKRVEKAA